MEDKHPEDYHFSKMKELVLRHFQGRKFKSLIDVGCGDGYLSSFFQDICSKMYGFDANEDKIKIAKWNCPKAKFEVKNLEESKIQGEHDFIIFSDVIYYLTPNTQKRIMEEIHEHLTYDGVLLTSRHLANGDQELGAYQHLFKKIDTEDVFNVGSSLRWRITLWKKIS